MWNELGIPPTSDLKLIRKAYAARLRLVDKSGDRAAFQRLRAAYERAVALAQGGTARPRLEIAPADEPPRPAEPQPVVSQPEASEEEPHPTLHGQIDHAVQSRDLPLALKLYEGGLARGLIPFGTRDAILEDIMRIAVPDGSLTPDAFCQLMQRVGWEGSVGQPTSSLRAAALSRLEAENWYRRLAATARGAGNIWFELRRSRPTQWLGVLLRLRWQKRNALLLLCDRPQLYRILGRNVADLRSKLAHYRQYEAWLKHRFAPASIARAERLSAFDMRWGGLLRKFVVAVMLGSFAVAAGWGGDWVSTLLGLLIMIALFGLMVRVVVAVVVGIANGIRSLMRRGFPR